MILIINGSCGIGKTSVSWELLKRFDRAVMLDGDHIGAVHPFEIYDEARVRYLYDTMAHLIAFHQSHGRYQHFIINYVFESAETLADLVATLAPCDLPIYAFRLVAAPSAIEARLRQRETGDALRWHLQRYQELLDIQNEAAQQGDLGRVIDTTHLTISAVGDAIITQLPHA